MRVGIGYDIHRFVKDKPLMLGGIEIPHIMGLEGHSDGDALIHAICDAILGAGGLEDIGQLFPVDDDTYAGIDSTILLKKVTDKVKDLGYKIEYVDSVVISEEPKIAPFKTRMKEVLADTLGITKENVNIKATTQEGIGALGRGEAIAVYAVACLAR